MPPPLALQYWWLNQREEGGKYTSFDDFLMHLRQSKRKNIRQVCKACMAQGVGSMDWSEGSACRTAARTSGKLCWQYLLQPTLTPNFPPFPLLQERKRATADNGLKVRRLVGADIKPEHWDAFYDFYRNTTDRCGSRFCRTSFCALGL